jgi:hypothetical protein
MYRFALMLPVCVILMLAAASTSLAAPVGSSDEVGRAIMACWSPPADWQGSLATLRFSFKRDGTLIGPPQPTEINVAGDEQARQQFLDAAIAAIEQCLPLQLSPSFAAGVGGQVFTLTFTGSGKLSVAPAN